MHTLRGNLSPTEASTALSNLAEASIATVLSAVAEECANRQGHRGEGGIAAAVLGDPASPDQSPILERRLGGCGIAMVRGAGRRHGWRRVR